MGGRYHQKYGSAICGIDRFHSRGRQPCKFIGTKEFNSHRIGLVHQHGRRFIVLRVHQYGCHDVM